MTESQEGPEEVVNPTDTVYNLRDFGVTNIFAPDVVDTLIQEGRKRFGGSFSFDRLRFEVPEEVGGLMRMVGDTEFASATDPQSGIHPRREFFIVPSGDPAENAPERVSSGVEHPNKDYSHVLYIPREHLDRFEPLELQLHSNFDEGYPAIVLEPTGDYSEWKWENLRPIDVTEQIRQAVNPTAGK